MTRNFVRSLLFSAVFVLPSALFGYPAVTDNAWQAVDGDASGVVTNVAHWKGGHLPALHELMKFNVDADYTVSFPTNETVAYPAGAYLNAKAGRTLSFVGDRATWYTPTTTEDNYAQFPISFCYAGNSFCTVNQQWSTDVSNHAIFEFTDFAFALSNTTDSANLVFERGTYNFYDPHGESWGDLKKSGTITTYPPLILHAYSAPTKSTRVVFGPQSSLRASDLSIHGYAAQTVTEFRGGTHEVFGEVLAPKVGGGVQDFASTNTFLVTDGAKLTVNSKFNFGHANQSRKTHRVVVSGGATLAVTNEETSVSRKSDSSDRVEFEVTDGGRLETWGTVQLGAYKGHRDAVSVSNGTWIAKKGVTFGCGTFVVEGEDSVVKLGAGLTVGSTAQTTATELRAAELTVKSGSVDLIGDLILGGSKNTSGTIRLTGGCLRCQNIYSSADAGESAVIADGGKIAVRSASALFGNIGSVTIGPGGLVVDTEKHTLTLSQNISGTGTITFIGGGTVDFVPGTICTAGIAVQDGVTLCLHDVVPGSLTLGAAGSPCKMSVTPSVTHHVNGPVTFVDAVLTFPKTTVEPGLYSLFTGTSAAGEEAWEAVESNIMVPDGYAAIFEVNGGSLDVDVRVPQVTNVSIDAPGRKTVDEDISVHRADVIAASAVAGGELTLSGVLGRGQLQKSGDGIVRLTNATNDLTRGISVSGGTLTLDFGEAEKREASLAVASDDLQKGVIVKADSDVAFADARMTSGAFIKRGVGTLTLEIPAARDWSALAAGDIVQPGNSHGWPYLPFPGFDASGAVPESGYGIVNVAEGELVIRGTAGDVPNVVLPSGRNTLVGLGNATGGANPRLVLDHVNYDSSRVSTLDIVSGLRENAFETSASLVVTNGANARLKHFTAGSAGLMSAVKETGPVKVVPVSVLVDNSLLGGDYGMVLSAGSDMSVTNVFVVRNGSRVVKGDTGHIRYMAYGPVRIEATDSEMTAVDLKTGVEQPAEYLVYSDGASQSLDFTRSRLALKSLTFNDGVRSSTVSPFTFEDSEWWPGAENFDFLPDTFSNVVINVRGKGLILAPTEGVTYTMSLDVNGEGGMVKRGAGTLVLRGEHQEFAGALVIEDGAVDLDGTVTAGRFAGTGTLRNGTLRKATLAVDGTAGESEALTLDGVGTSERNYVDLCGSALPVGATLTVANYTGAEPDVSGWKLIGNGETAGKFTAAGGKILAEITPKPGVLILVR